MENTTNKMEVFIKQNPLGGFNGYVCIPNGHKLHGVHYDEMHEYICDLDVHGGLTFSMYAEYTGWAEIPDNSKDSWVVGFDTCHAFDTLEEWPEEEVLKETQRLEKQLSEYI